MFLTRSTGRKVVATVTAAVTFALLYEVTTLDSRYAARQAELREATAHAGARRAPALHRHGLLQGHDDRLRRQRPDGHRRGGSRTFSRSAR